MKSIERKVKISSQNKQDETEQKKEMIKLQISSSFEKDLLLPFSGDENILNRATWEVVE